ncbi:LysR family transcriptional regulator [Shewanella salipaludis]|uniref:LysR family transcriptional regulator n=1 Tax=Shewanella salipaludis TaxID=2723052 RepID=UPI001B7D02E6|nr:LysR family transcriptional regulator [Shewanella salipaludis]
MIQLHQHLPHLYVFRLVASLGSFQAAATELALPRSSVSKKVMQLEQYMEQRLLQRSTRQLRLTEAGLSLLEATQGLTALLDNTEQLRLQQQHKPIGRVKISSSTLLGQRFLLPRVAELRRRYPEVTIDLSLDDSVVDLIATGVDLALRVGHLPDSSLIARRVGQKSWAWVASPGYLQQHGTPATPDDLKQHQCIVFKNRDVALNHWSFADEHGRIETQVVEEAIAVDDGRTLVELACMDQGIVMLDLLLVQRELALGLLQPILGNWQHPETSPIHLLCLGKAARSKAVDCVWQALVPWLQADLAAAAQGESPH